MMINFQKPRKLTKDRCPACSELSLEAIGVNADHPVIKDNIVAKCKVCGTISELNRDTLADDEVED